MKYKAVVFDLDGTLLDTLGDILAAINEMLEKLNYKTVTYDCLKTMIGDGARKMVERATNESDAEKVTVALDMYNEIYKNTTGKTIPFEGITELVSVLKTNGIKLAVLSNKPYKEAISIVKRIMGEYTFDIIIGQSEKYKVKPDTAGLSKIVSVFGLDISDCLYVGDGEMDYLTPAALKMRVLSALWGYRTMSQLEKVGANEFIDKPCEVLKFM